MQDFFTEGLSIYEVLNLNTMKPYYGQSVNVVQQLQHHYNTYIGNRHTVKDLQQASNACTAACFQYSVLFQGPGFKTKSFRLQFERALVYYASGHNIYGIYNLLPRLSENKIHGRYVTVVLFGIKLHFKNIEEAKPQIKTISGAFFPTSLSRYLAQKGNPLVRPCTVEQAQNLSSDLELEIVRQHVKTLLNASSGKEVRKLARHGSIKQNSALKLNRLITF